MRGGDLSQPPFLMETVYWEVSGVSRVQEVFFLKVPMSLPRRAERRRVKIRAHPLGEVLRLSDYSHIF